MIQHADLIRAVLDGKTVQQRTHDRQGEEGNSWKSMDADTAIYQMSGWPWWPKGVFRLKPEPHKWQREMDAQAAGRQLQIRGRGDPGWEDQHTEFYFEDKFSEYRIKPVTKDAAFAALEVVAQKYGIGEDDALDVVIDFIEEAT